jgi:hypothetical protein
MANDIEQEAHFQVEMVPGGKWDVCYMARDEFYSEYAYTEADARAKMLIYLVENGLNRV